MRPVSNQPAKKVLLNTQIWQCKRHRIMEIWNLDLSLNCYLYVWRSAKLFPITLAFCWRIYTPSLILDLSPSISRVYRHYKMTRQMFYIMLKLYLQTYQFWNDWIYLYQINFQKAIKKCEKKKAEQQIIRIY